MERNYNDLFDEDKTDTEIILIRHGKTEWNTIHKMQGQFDSKLTNEGISGAIQIGRKLFKLHKYDRKISCLYSSPLGRAKQTAKLIMEQFDDDNKLKINYNEKLMARHMGNLQGKKYDEIKQNEPEIYKEINSSNVNYKPPGIESETSNDTYNRAINILIDLIVKHHGQRILIITHGCIILRILRDILFKCNDSLSKRFVVKNCAINIIRKDVNDKTCHVSVLGDDNYGHLKELQMSEDKDECAIIQNKLDDFNKLKYLMLGFVIGYAVRQFMLK